MPVLNSAISLTDHDFPIFGPVMVLAQRKHRRAATGLHHTAQHREFGFGLVPIGHDFEEARASILHAERNACELVFVSP